MSVCGQKSDFVCPVSPPLNFVCHLGLGIKEKGGGKEKGNRGERGKGEQREKGQGEKREKGERGK